MREAVRRQLTLFASGASCERLEAMRRRLDPVQSRLIAAHVTLCREDELGGLAEADLAARLAGVEPLTLVFGRAEPFHGHGLLLPCVDGETGFHALRRRALGRNDVRAHAPHVTLAHPRNPKADGNSLAVAHELTERLELDFRSVALIEQAGAEPWRVLCTLPLGRG